MQIGQYIKLLREERGLSLSELARQAHISKGYLHTIEKGECDPSLTIVDSLAFALDINTGWMIDCAKRYQPHSKSSGAIYHPFLYSTGTTDIAEIMRIKSVMDWFMDCARQNRVIKDE